MSSSNDSYQIQYTSPFVMGYNDLKDGILRLPLARHLAKQDIRMRYRRTVIGPFWTVLNAIIFVAILGVVYSFLFKLDLQQYLPFFSIGYFVWMTMIALCMESSTSFTSAELIIKNMRVPYTTHIIRCVWRNVLTFFHMIPVAIALSLYFDVTFDLIAILKIFLGILLLIVNGTWVAILVGIVATRYRDFQQIVATVLQIVFFITPIFWDPKILEGHKWPELLLADLNPFFQQIQVIRSPMIGWEIDWSVYGIMAVASIFGLLIATLSLGWAKRHISIWL